ncbi:MAG TPA: hypothetical protein VFX30_09480 [bacterium]|nr:hypothetical protein [bacterium]
MTTYFVRLSGTRSGITDISFDADPNADAATLRARASEALYARLGTRSHDYARDIEFSLYRDNGDGTFNATTDTRLGLNAAGDTVDTWDRRNGTIRFNNPFRANIVPREAPEGSRFGPDSPTGYVSGFPASLHLPDSVRTGLSTIVFQSNGRANVQPEEAQSFIRELEKLFRGRTFTIDGHEVRGEDLLRDVVSSGQVNMGPSEGNLSLQDAYRIAGLDPSQAGSRTDADFARLLGETPAGLSGDAPGVTPDSVVNDFINNPSTENLQRLRADRAATDRLIQRLLAALEQGNLDVLMPLMDAVARVSNLTVAEIGARTARLLGASDRQAGEIGRNLQNINTSSTDPAARARANQDLQAMQLQLQQNTQARQQIVGMLQSTMEMSRSIGDANKELRQANLARQRASLMG